MRFTEQSNSCCQNCKCLPCICEDLTEEENIEADQKLYPEGADQ